MAKKTRKRGCFIDGCKDVAVGGAKACKEHLHPIALQAEIERLRSAHPEGLWPILRYREVRQLLSTLGELERRATPLKAGNIEVVARSRGHNLGDGIVVLGSEEEDEGWQPAMPATAVSTYRDRGRLGAAIAEVKRTAGEVAKIADPHSPPSWKTCGSRGCPEPNRHQPIEVRYCAYCGRSLQHKGGR